MQPEGYFEFSAIKGMQAGHPYYAIMCPLHMVAKFFTYTDNSLPADMRAQRVLNKQRIPEMRDYILNNKDSYVFSALTASVDGKLSFDPTNEGSAMGQLKIPFSARILINDGQHRRAAIEAALEDCPDLRHEDISIVLYYDLGLTRSQQMFSDLNRYAIRPTKSLNILFDNRDAFSIMLRECITQVPMFQGSVENEKSSLSNRSKELFTLSGLFYASKLLFRGMDIQIEEIQEIVIKFWNAVADNMPDWQKAKNKEIAPDVFRQKFICAHAIALKALGELGNNLVSMYPEKTLWGEKLGFLKHIEWEKSNPELQGLVIIDGRISSSQSNQKAFAKYLLERSGWGDETGGDIDGNNKK